MGRLLSTCPCASRSRAAVTSSNVGFKQPPWIPLRLPGTGLSTARPRRDHASARRTSERALGRITRIPRSEHLAAILPTRSQQRRLLAHMVSVVSIERPFHEADLPSLRAGRIGSMGSMFRSVSESAKKRSPFAAMSTPTWTTLCCRSRQARESAISLSI